MKISKINIANITRMRGIDRMLTYSFSNIGSETLYGHLYQCIKNDILDGILSPGSKLPSKRSFAANLGVSTITVESAYGQLLAEGFIYSVPKQGYYVESIQNEIQQKKSAIPPILKAQPVRNEYFADFVSNQTEPANFPFAIWTKLMREIISHQSKELMQNPPAGGVMILREAIAAYLKEFRGMQVQPEQIVVGAGTEYLYGLLIQLLGTEKSYAVEDPGYRKVAKIYTKHGVKCSYIPIDHNGILVNALSESGAGVVHVSPSHHYPTGIVTPVSRRYELLGWASQKEGRYILEDDFDSEFRMAGNPLPTLQSIDATEKVIYLNTFTKSLASTIRISYMVLPPHLAQRYYAELGFYSCTVSTFEQYTLAHFLSEGYFEKHINRTRMSYRRKRDTLIQAIVNNLPADAAAISEEEAGLHFLLQICTDCTDRELVRKAERCGLRVSCLSDYYECFPGDLHTLVLNYSNVAEERLQEAALRLQAMLK